MLIETTEDFKRVKKLLLKEGIRTITPYERTTKIKFLVYKNEMLFFKFDSEYNEEIILDLKTGVEYWLSTEAEILMSKELLSPNTNPIPREKASLLCAANKLPPEELEKALKEAESILAEKKKRTKSDSDNVSSLESLGIKDMYDKLVSDLDQGSVTYTFDAKVMPTKE